MASTSMTPTASAVSVSEEILAGEGSQSPPNRLSASAGECSRERASLLKRLLFGAATGVRTSYELLCLVILLGLLSMIPVIQVIAFGYLLDLSGRISRTGRLRDGPSHLSEAAILVTALASLYIFSLPALFLGSGAHAAELITAGNPEGPRLQFFSRFMAALAFVYLVWAWSRGGRLRDYCWPAPRRFLSQAWRIRYWREAYQRFWGMMARLEIPRLFSLGLRGLVGTTVWVGLPAILLIATARQGQTGLAGLIGFFGAITMGCVLIYLPFLQTQFAAENRFRALFEVRRVRQAFCRSPLLFWFALVTTFLLAVPPYLFKIEAVPREIAWLPAAVVVAFVFPGRLITGWAMWRGTHSPERQGWLWVIWRTAIRLAIPPVILSYLFVIYATQFTSWHGLATWFQQHAVSVPVPFTGT